MTDIPWDRLFVEAEQARKRAYAPYSRFQVGAAVLGANGVIYSGCNVENASYGLTVCAERNAVARMIADGEQKLIAAAILVDSGEATPPCGTCRQVFVEFGEPKLPVRSRNLRGDEQSVTLEQLLPGAFTRRYL